MLDLKRIRTETDAVKAAIKKREMDLDAVVDEILSLDEKRRTLQSEVGGMKAEQNAVTKKIPQIKKEGGDVAAVMAEMKTLSAAIKEKDAALSEAEAALREQMLRLPNLPDPDVVAGGKEQNVPLSYDGEQPKIGRAHV